MSDRYIFYPRKQKPHIPVMEAWPDMLTYLDRAQRRRPSYHAWSLFAGRKAASFGAQSAATLPQGNRPFPSQKVDSK